MSGLDRRQLLIGAGSALLTGLLPPAPAALSASTTDPPRGFDVATPTPKGVLLTFSSDLALRHRAPRLVAGEGHARARRSPAILRRP